MLLGNDLLLFYHPTLWLGQLHVSDVRVVALAWEIRSWVISLRQVVHLLLVHSIIGTMVQWYNCIDIDGTLDGTAASIFSRVRNAEGRPLSTT